MSDPLDQLKQWRETTESDNYADLVDLAREATPVLLTAVENVLKLAERERSAIRATYAPDVPYHQYANAMDDVVTAIRDAIGGAT